MAVVWQGVEQRVRHWDVHGFALDAPFPRVMAPGRGRVFDLTLLIGQGSTRIEMRVQARAESVPEDEAPTRFIFVDLERAQAEVLHRIVDHVVSDQAMSLTTLLNETEDTRAERRETGARVRAFRSGFQLLLAAGVLVVAGALTWSSFSTVTARYAAVTVTATGLSVPVAGLVSQITVRPGQSVGTGDVLGYVRPANYEDRALDLADRRRGLEAEQARLMAQRGAVTQLATLAPEQGLGGERGRLEEGLRLAERRLAVERSQLAAMQGNGLPTAARLRDRARQEAAVLEAESRVIEARSRLEVLARSEVLAPVGLGQGSGALPDAGTLDEQIAVLAADIEHLRQREDHATFGEPILSPCDCIVDRVDRRPGEWARPEEQLAVLIGRDAPTVHALVLAESARSIDLGDLAQIELADGTAVRGRVSRMNYDAHWLGYTGLQDNVFAADRYARVEITPETPLTAPVGMVASVDVHTSSLLGQVRSFVGI
jgi:multidrug resistance efflux pump